MNMSKFFETTPMRDLVIYRPPVFRDERGYFTESYNQQHFSAIGIDRPFVQDNRSFSRQGALRGLHLQLGSAAQAKLVGVLSGRVYDVAVDLRPESPTFGQTYGLNLDASEDPTFFYVPRGFAHGFLVLSPTAEFYYKVDNFYAREAEAGVHFLDQDLNISWPKLEVPFILSDKDEKLPSLKDFIKKLEELAK